MGMHQKAVQYGEQTLASLRNQDATESLGWLLSDLGGFSLNMGYGETFDGSA